MHTSQFATNKNETALEILINVKRIWGARNHFMYFLITVGLRNRTECATKPDEGTVQSRDNNVKKATAI